MDYLRESITNLTKVSMTITKHLFSKEEYKDKNVVFSPLSLQTALSLLAVGSEGPTQHQLLAFLGSKSIGHLNSLSSHLASSVLKDAAPAGGPRLSSANAVWVEKTLSLYPSFKETVATDYMATLKSLDFINKVLSRNITIFLFCFLSRTINFLIIFYQLIELINSFVSPLNNPCPQLLSLSITKYFTCLVRKQFNSKLCENYIL